MGDQKYLPLAVVNTALPRLQEAVLNSDPTALAAIKAWGFATIARVYDPDPILRPHHYLMKRLAEAEWRRLLHEHERRLRQIMVQKAEEAWTVELDERIADRRFEGAERRRRDTESWNRHQRVGEYIETRGFDTDEQIRLARALAEINGPAQLAADPQERVRQLEQAIARIENDPTLTSAMKHRRTEPLQQAIRDLYGGGGRGPA